MRSSPPAPLSERTAASSGIARPHTDRTAGRTAKYRETGEIPAGSSPPSAPTASADGNTIRERLPRPLRCSTCDERRRRQETTPETTHARNGPARRTIRAHAPIRAERMHSVAARPERAVAASRRWRKDNGTEKGCRSVATFRETPSRPRCGSHGGESRIRAETRPAALRRLRPPPRAKIRSGCGYRAPATRGGCGRCRR